MISTANQTASQCQGDATHGVFEAVNQFAAIIANDLSDSQRGILTLAVAGNTSKEIANHLGICKNSLAKKKKAICKKLGVDNLTLAVRVVAGVSDRSAVIQTLVDENPVAIPPLQLIRRAEWHQSKGEYLYAGMIARAALEAHVVKLLGPVGENIKKAGIYHKLEVAAAENLIDQRVCKRMVTIVQLAHPPAHGRAISRHKATVVLGAVRFFIETYLPSP